MRIPLSACALMRRRVKPSSPAWVSSTWRSSLIGYCASSRWTLTWDVRRSLIESLFVTELRRLKRDSSGRRVDAASTVTLSSTWSRQRQEKVSALRTRSCLLYTSDAADDLTRVDLGGRRLIKK